MKTEAQNIEASEPKHQDGETKQRQRRDPYQLVTDLILHHLEQGTVPWRRPWNREVGRPRNYHTGKPYQGVNLMLLGCRRFASPFWVTLQQANKLGGHVRKGEHGTIVVKYGRYQRKLEGEEGKTKPAFFLKEYIVFNALQIVGFEFPTSAQHQPLSSEKRIEVAEQIVAAMPSKPKLEEGKTTQACYHRKMDIIKMPAFERFENAEGYYQTLFHELIHATGHESRLNRPTLVNNDGNGGKEYSKEELVAEMGAAFLGMEADIVQNEHEQSAAYVKSWLDALCEPDHRRWIVEAGNHATKAAQFVLGNFQPEAQAAV